MTPSKRVSIKKAILMAIAVVVVTIVGAGIVAALTCSILYGTFYLIASMLSSLKPTTVIIGWISLCLIIIVSKIAYEIYTETD